MGWFNGLGNIAGGYARARDSRVASKNPSPTTPAKTPVAEGVGGTPVDKGGKPIKVPPGGLTEQGMKDAQAAGSRTLGQKIGSGIKSGLGSLFGFKNGGRITKSGVGFLHKGETVIPATQERKAFRVSARKSSRR